MKRALFVIFFVMIAATASAATYYVDPVGGHDTYCTGQSGVAYGGSGTGQPCAWKSITKVNNSVSGNGDKVYFKAGTTTVLPASPTTGLTVDWATPTIGSYYLNESNTAVVGTGSYGPAKISGSNGTYPSGWPGNYYSAIRVLTANATIQDLEILEVNGNGIWIEARDGYTPHNPLVQRVKVHHCRFNGLTFVNLTTPTVKYCDVWENDEYDARNYDTPDPLTAPPGWGAGVCFRACTNALFQYNRVWRNWGEGVGNFAMNNGTKILDNVLYDNRRPNFYNDCSTGTKVARNLIYRTQNTITLTPSYWNLIFTAEDWHGASYCDGLMGDFDIWGNMISGGSANFIADTPYPDPLDGIRVYNNTFVEPMTGTNGQVNVKFANVANAIFKNNIILQSAGNTTPISSFSTGTVTRSNNIWSHASGSVDADARGTGDVYSSWPITKTTGWAYSTLTSNSLTGAEFAPASGSAASVDAGVNLCPSGCSAGLEYNTLISSNGTDLTVPTWINATQSGTWDVGAIPYESVVLPTTGMLTGEVLTTPATVNLTAEGTLDWHRFGYASGETNTRKSGTQLISDWVKYGTLDPTHWVGNTAFPFYSWTDGTPTATGTDTYGMMVRGGVNEGIKFTIPALAGSARKARVYFGGYSANVKLIASLGDSSASPYVYSFSTGASVSVKNRCIELEFFGETATTLTVSIYVESDLGGGNVNFQAVTLWSSSGTGSNNVGLPAGATNLWKLSADLEDFIGSAHLTATGTVSQTADRFDVANSARKVAAESTANRLSAADNASLNPSGSMTALFWIRREGPLTNDNLNWVLGKGSTNRPWTFRYSTYTSSDTLNFGVKSTSGTPSGYATFTFSNELPLNQWVHVAGVFDATAQVARIYVDGVKGTDYSTGFSTLYNDTESFFVFSNGSVNAIPGSIDDIVIYPRALTLDEINIIRALKTDAAAVSPPSVPTPIIKRLLQSLTINSVPNVTRDVLK